MNGPESGDVKSRVLQATDIVELIGRTVALKRRGKDFVGLCPFHQEKTGSFHVSPTRQFFHCYGCKKGGNAIDFVIERDRIEFVDAMRQLAEAAGIEWRTGGVDKKDISERQILLEAQSAAAQFFEKLLSHPQQGQAARDYLAKRGFNEESIQRFHIGLAPNAWDGLLKSPLVKKITPPQLALAGLAKQRDSAQGGYYDTFRNRLMFPIRDENARVIAFGGRVMPDSEDQPKYLNSPETPLFSKSRCIYGIDLARSRIVETRTVAVVEGYTDVVMAHQCGVSNVVSVLGTALTEQHVSILRRFADRIVLLFDPDSAGDNAVNRAVELFLTQPVDIAIASLPDGKDPDEFLLEGGAEAFNRVLADASDALTYKWKQLLRRMKDGNGLTNQQQAVGEYLETLAKARGSGPVDVLRWGQALSRVSRLTEIPVDVLNQRFKIKGPIKRVAAVQVKASDAGPAQVSATDQPTINARGGPLSARQRAEGLIMGLLLAEPGRWDSVLQHIAPEDFTDELLRQIADLFWRHQQDEGEPVLNEFLGVLSTPELKSAAVHWVDEVLSASDAQALWAGSLEHLSQERRRNEERKLIAQLRRTSSESANTKADELSEDIAALRSLQEKARQPDLRRVGS